MAAKYGPHLERLGAVAGSLSGRLVAMGGEREAGPDESSAVHVLEVAKLTPSFAGEVDSAVRSLCFLTDDLLVAGTARGELCKEIGLWRVALAFGFVFDVDDFVGALPRRDG